MNQQLSALLRGQHSLETPRAAGQSENLSKEPDGPHTFAHTLDGELGDSTEVDASKQVPLTDLATLLSTIVLQPAVSESGVPNMLDDSGNNSPQSGSDLPSSQLPTTITDPAAILTPQLILPDAVLALTGAAIHIEIPASSMVLESPPSSTPSQIFTLGLAPDNPVKALLHVEQDSSSLIMKAQVEAGLSNEHAPPRHTAKDLELLASVASVLIPMKDRTLEKFESIIPAPLNTLPSDTITSNISTPALNMGMALPSNIAATSFIATGKADISIPQPPGQPGWSDVFADRVTFVVKQGWQEAEIRLNPPQLGQVDVRIVMNNDQANLMFSSPHGAVREAIELSMGRLRDMLADSGFNLVNVDVSDKSLTQQHKDAREQRESGQRGAQGEYRADFEVAGDAPERLRAMGARSIDYYV